MKLNRTIIFQVILALFLTTSVYKEISAQKNISSNPLVEKGDVVFNEGLYDKALTIYKKAYSKSRGLADKAELSYKIAETYNRLTNSAQALVWYEKASSLKYGNPELYKKLALVSMTEKKYDEALKHFNRYKVEMPNDPTVEENIKSIKKALDWIENPKQLEIKNMVLLNTPNAEINPFLYSEKVGKVELYFTSNREGAIGSKSSAVTGANFTDIYSSKRDKKGKWSEPYGVETLNTEFSDGGITFNSKRKTAYFTRCVVDKAAKKGCAIYYAKKQGNNFGEPTKLELAPDSVTVGHPALTPNDKVMVFASDMEGTLGGKDLWYVTYDKKTRAWSTTPINLGSEINTTGDELYPFIDSEGSLYFSSNGFPGMGGWDLYQSKSIGVNQWGKPENLKVPYNSNKNDMSICFQRDLNKGFISSDRDGNFDIYEFYKPPLLFVLEGVVKNIETQEPISGALVKVFGTDGTIIQTSTDDQGAFSFIKSGDTRYIKPQTSYSVLVARQNYLNAKGKESTIGLKQSRKFVHEYSLQEYKNKTIKLPEVLYEFGKATLLPESKDSLNFLYDIMTDNPNITILLRSHTDHIGSDEANLKLSQERSKSCVDYLVKEKGIDARRIEAKGMGEAEPVVSGGVTLTSEYIESLPSSVEKDAARQRNRRTDFKVIRDDYKP